MFGKRHLITTLFFGICLREKETEGFSTAPPAFVTRARLHIEQKRARLFTFDGGLELALAAASHDLQERSSNEAWETEGREDNEAVDISDEDNELLVEYERWCKAVDKAIKGLEKKQKSLLTELDKAEKVQDKISRANLITTYLYMFTPGVTSVTVQDWEQDGKEVTLTLDPSYGSAADEADDLFQQVRKLKRGSQIVGELVEKTSQALEMLLEMKNDLNASLTGDSSAVDEHLLRLVQDRLIRTSRTTQFTPPTDMETTESHSTSQTASHKPTRQQKPVLGTPSSNVRKITTDAGSTILVGRNRRGNEYLSLTVARGNDLWMHARGTPGAHVLLLQRRGAKPASEACLQLAADLAAFYSDARAERRAEVTVTLPKHVQKPRGAPLGAVKLREEMKSLIGYPNQVPDHLKEAREASGLSDEYRATDKAKLRKQNRRQQTAKKLQAKKARAKTKRQEKYNDSEDFY